MSAEFQLAVRLYRKRFHDTPTIVALNPDAYAAAAAALRDAVKAGKPLSDDEFAAACSMEPLPDGALA